MRAKTKKKHEIRKRFALVIGVAAVGVMALGAQRAAPSAITIPPGQAPPTCDGKPATIVGASGGDILKGTPGPDVIVAGGQDGDDSVKGNGGNDVICGNGSHDGLMGGPGNDILLGQKGKDALDGGKGKDLCNGGAGHDVAPAMGSHRVDTCEVEKSIEGP
jgi:Ca2+-binding RTX toxin-like protein